MVRLDGPSAGQTAIFFLMDLVLGVQHKPAMVDFQRRMRLYIPAPHAALITRVEQELAQVGSICGLATSAADASKPAFPVAHDTGAFGVATLRLAHAKEGPTV